MTNFLNRSRGEAESWKETLTPGEIEEAKQTNEAYKKGSKAIERFKVNAQNPRDLLDLIKEHADVKQYLSFSLYKLCKRAIQ